MDLPLARARASSLELLPSVGSTNTELVRVAGERMHGAVVATFDQRAGRGRLGRVWTAPPGACLAASVMLRPVSSAGTALPLDRFGWFPLLAGACLAEAIADVLGASAGRDQRVAVKWPNDVQVGRRKISGVLAELVAASGAVVVGTGVNLTLAVDQLPVPTATSLALEGADGDASALADRVLAGYLDLLLGWTARFTEAGDAERSGLRDFVIERCSTPGLPVRIVRAGRDDVEATAIDLDHVGRLVVRLPDGSVEALAAGDVTHLRPR
ncbi:MAG: biotin--[acetyl-CoA-carboxylase] ligase [Gaiellaceae bacterium]